MKSYLAILFFSVFQLASGQNPIKKVFVQKNFINGNFYREVKDTIEVTGKIDIHFLSKQFYLPYYIPAKFIDERYKNQTISIWADPNGKKDYNKNWESKYTYDSLGRVVNYSYSSCFLCSQTPYDYNVKYNSSDMVEEIHSTLNYDERFKLFYNGSGDIIRLQKFLFDILELVIELEN